MALADAFKSNDVQLGAIELVTPVLAKTQKLILNFYFKFLLAPHGETKAENIYHCQNVCGSCEQFKRTNLLNNC